MIAVISFFAHVLHIIQYRSCFFNQANWNDCQMRITICVRDSNKGLSRFDVTLHATDSNRFAFDQSHRDGDIYLWMMHSMLACIGIRLLHDGYKAWEILIPGTYLSEPFIAYHLRPTPWLLVFWTRQRGCNAIVIHITLCIYNLMCTTRVTNIQIKYQILHQWQNGRHLFY